MDQTDALLAAQYEAYPYPLRDPKDEAKRLITGSPGHLREIDYWIFGARRPAARPLRALFAGAGSGDGTIMLAQQLQSAGRPGQVTWLDRSASALAVARARAAARGLGNITWEQRSLLDLASSGLGPFDYIDCCGVLHHLPDPEAGLRALASVLAPGGGVGIMVYAPHGRTGVYMLQDSLRLLAPPGEAPPARLEVARRVLKHLPESAWLRANRNFADHITGGDAGLYDLLLNPRDVAFSVPALAALVAAAGLAVRGWIEPMKYDAATWLPDPKLRQRIASLSPAESAAVAEGVLGNMSTHVLYLARPEDAWVAPDFAAPDSVPVTRDGTGEELAKLVRPEGRIVFLFDGVPATIPMPAAAVSILRLIDGKRPVSEIAAMLAGRGLGAEAFGRAWAQIFTGLNRVNRLLIAPSLP